MPRHELIAGLDIGSTKISCLIAELGDQDSLRMLGLGVAPSSGIKRGAVVDVAATVEAIEKAVQLATVQAGREITSVYVGVTGEHVSSLNSRGVTAVTNGSREILQDDVDRAIQQSRVIVMPPDRQILHAIPRSFSIDGQGGVRNPLGMSGVRLEVESHIVTGIQSFLSNLQKCVMQAGLMVDELALQQLATSEAVLSDAERKQGVCLVDIGGGMTDIAIFHNGTIAYSAVVPVGSNHVTNDIAQLLRVTTQEAERLKLEHGTALSSDTDPDESVPIIQIGKSQPRPLRRRALADIIEARMQELFILTLKEIQKSGLQNKLGAGVVLTGGGCLLRSTQDCASEVLGLSVRMGKPGSDISTMSSLHSPTASTCVGLVLYGASQQISKLQVRTVSAGGGLGKFLSKIIDKMKTN